MEMFLLQMHFGTHLHHNSLLSSVQCRSQSLQLRREHFKGAILIIQSLLFLWTSKQNERDLKWYGVGKWWNCNFRYKISSIMCMGKQSHSVEQICFLRMLFGWQAGTNLISWFLWAVRALKIIQLAVLLDMGKPRHTEMKWLIQGYRVEPQWGAQPDFFLEMHITFVLNIKYLAWWQQ